MRNCKTHFWTFAQEDFAAFELRAFHAVILFHHQSNRFPRQLDFSARQGSYIYVRGQLPCLDELAFWNIRLFVVLITKTMFRK